MLNLFQHLSINKAILNLSMVETKKIPLFWWSEIRLMGKPKENYGDLLSKYLAGKISSKKIKWVQPKKQAWYKIRKRNYLSAGSIIHHATKHSIVWGSGIIDHVQKIAPADFRAVRGPKTREYLKKSGYECPSVYGDPALLLPIFYFPDLKNIYRIGLIPHYNDYEEIASRYAGRKDILVINLMTLDVEAVTDLILQCECTISSSLHGVIVSHAYGIPSVWVKFSNRIFGNGIKYIDYLESVDLELYQPEFMEDSRSMDQLKKLVESYPNLPSMKKIKELQDGLMKACPFI